MPLSINVLYFIAYYQRLAGANRSLFELVTNLPDYVRPLVVVAGEGMVAEAYRRAGIDVVVWYPGARLDQFGKAATRWSTATRMRVVLTELLPYTFKLFKLIRARRINLVHINDVRGAVLAGPAAWLARRPVVAHLRGEQGFSGVPVRLYEWISTRITAVCEAIIGTSLSPSARRKAVVVYNGTQDIAGPGEGVPWLRHLRARGVVIACCFASIVPFKGHHHLLEAVAELNRRGWRGRVAFFCVGDFYEGYEAYHRWLLERKRALDLGNVTFTGWQSDPFSFYRSADLTLLSTVREEQLTYNGQTVSLRSHEGFPRTNLEAMCFGLPVVSTDVAGVREQVKEGITGYVVSPSDPNALADALERLLTDPEQRQRMGLAGRERVLQEFSTQRYVEGVVSVYRRLMTA